MKMLQQQIAAWVLALAACIALPLGAQASIEVNIESVNATPGDAGFLEITLFNNSASSQTISGFSLEIALSGTGVNFTAIDSNTTLPYIFGTEGSGTLTSDPFTNTGFQEADASFNIAGFVTIAGYDSVGLGRIAFQVDTGISDGFRPVDVIAGSGTEFTDDAVNVVSIDSINGGGVEVHGVSVVPEPATMAIWLIGMGLGSLGYARRRR